MKHKKVLGTNDGDATHVGGQHWDEDHAYGLKDLVLVGILTWSHTLGDSYVNGSSLSGLLANPSVSFAANIFSCAVSLAPVPVVTTKTAVLRAVLADPGAIVPAGYRLNLWNNDSGSIELTWLNSSDAIVAPPASSNPTILLYALIT